MVRTWKDLKGIKYRFLEHSVPKYAKIHTHLNNIYQGPVDGATFADIFTDDIARDVLKPNCASLILDAIWEIVNNRASVMTEKDHLKGIMTGCKTKLVMNFMVGTDKKFLSFILI